LSRKNLESLSRRPDDFAVLIQKVCPEDMAEVSICVGVRRDNNPRNILPLDDHRGRGKSNHGSETFDVKFLDFQNDADAVGLDGSSSNLGNCGVRVEFELDKNA